MCKCCDQLCSIRSLHALDGSCSYHTEKLDRMNVKLQSQQRETMERVENELAKHPDVRPGTPEYVALLEKIHRMFPHNVGK